MFGSINDVSKKGVVMATQLCYQPYLLSMFGSINEVSKYCVVMATQLWYQPYLLSMFASINELSNISCYGNTAVLPATPARYVW